MFSQFLRTKLHRLTITAADPDYEGSVTIDRELCRAAGLREFEQVDVLDINNGARFTTYVIYGDKGEFQVNGAAAQLVSPGHLAIVLAYAALTPEEIQTHRARVVLMDTGNVIKSQQDLPIRNP